MKIRLYYASKLDRDTIILDVPDSECEVMVETDYQQRLAQAKPEDRDAVSRRDPQTIINEECNKPTFNSHHAETRRHVALEALDPEGDHIGDGFDVEEAAFPEDWNDLHQAIDRLRPRQKELLRKIFWEEMKQAEIAKAEGLTDQALHNRLARIYERLRRYLSEKQ